MIGQYTDRFYDEAGRRRETPKKRQPRPVTRGRRKSRAPETRRRRIERLELLPREVFSGPVVRPFRPSAKEIETRAREGYVPLRS